MPSNTEIDTKTTSSQLLETFMQKSKANKSSKGPVLLFFENCRSNNTCILKIKDELRMTLYKYYMSTREKIGLVSISYRENGYITAANRTSLNGWGQFLSILMNFNNSVTIKVGCLLEKNLSSNYFITLTNKYSIGFYF